MQNLCVIVVMALCVSVCQAAELPRSTPEAQGVSSAGVLEFVEAVDKKFDSLNSVMVLRHGHVVAEGWWAPYHAQAPHSLYSLSKSFTSTAVGLAIADGKLSLDDEVLKFFPEDAPAEPSDNLKKMRVSDLLRMSTGQQTEPPRTNDVAWTKSFLTHPVPFKPGTHFLYNTSATYMQSAIVQKVTGMTLLDYLRPRLFEPLGIEKPTWEISPQGISTGGYGLSIRTEDIARFGQLYLQKGMWEGKQLVPEAWIEAATARQTSNGSNPASDWDQGYGYQFWRGRHGCYRGDGAFGQYCIVLPRQDAVIAITSGLKDMQLVLDVIWDKLLPAIHVEPLAADDQTRMKLESTLKGLSLRPQDGEGHPAKVLGKQHVFPPSEHKLQAVKLLAGEQDGATTLVMRFDGVEHRIECARGKWNPGKAGWGTLAAQPVAASGAWISDDTFAAKLCFYETPFVITVKLKFAGDEIHYHAQSNVGFGPKNEFQLIGIAGEKGQGLSQLVPADVNPAQRSAVTQAGLTVTNPAAVESHDFAKWEKAIANFESSDRLVTPPKGGVLFIGSSTIGLWKTLAEDFPNHQVIDRGFGGSEIVDSTHFADRIVFPYEPKQVFLRAGGNDLQAGRLPEEVAADFADFVKTVHSRLPKTEIYFIALSPAPARWGQKDKGRVLNALIREQALHMPRVSFAETEEITLDSQGQARKELFVADMLHLNADGYKLLAEAVRPYLPTGK